ncbi:transposase, partial [Sphingobacterium sp. MYb382]|uniref:transposase n=1 Tax=Sphingobacterium sp. MYb382 TaxID=2745278 RepID=UPI0030A0D62A
STNAAAESFNAKLKAFRAIFRGVRDTKFFLYRVMKAYDLALAWAHSIHTMKSKEGALTKLALWHHQAENAGIESFESVARSIAAHHPNILHYFDNRSTNAAAESFNAKLKAFRAIFRGVRDTKFFLYRVMKLYA